MGTFEDRVIVVTGAGSGLGRCLALEFARAGARVHGVDLDSGRVEEVEREARQAGWLVTGHRADCADAEAVRTLGAHILDNEGRVDVLVNNAGVCVAGRAEDITLQDWEWITNVNWWAAVHGVRMFLPGMIARRSGHIVNVASMAGLLPLPGVVPYCATKAAVAAMSESLAIEVAAAGVRVTTVYTGTLRTRVLADGRLDLPQGFRGRLLDLMARFAPPPERAARRIAKAVRRGRRFVRMPGELWPLWILRRLSMRLYLAALAFGFRVPMRMWRTADTCAPRLPNGDE